MGAIGLAGGLPGSYLIDLILLVLPMVACALVAARLGITNPLLLLGAGVGGSGVLAIAVFWAYLANPYFGRGVAIALTAASAVVMAEACRHGFTAWKALRSLAPVTALFVASGFFNAAMAYLHERFAYESNPAVNRYLTGLPSDNVLPWFFARQLEAKARPLPAYLVPGWQSSDRPPLQTGYYLMQHAVLGTSNFNDYVLVGILLQSFWILGLWALLHSMGKDRRSVATCLLASVFNGFILQNTVFTWPKLLAAAGAMLTVAVLCTRQIRALRRSRAAGALTGATAGAAMMGHPGSAFALGGVAAVIAALWLFPGLRPIWWKPPTLRFLWPTGVLFACCYAPWSLYYQKHYRPPANALTELQLANAQPPVPGKTTIRVTIDAYQRAGLHRAVSNKISNMETPFKHTLDYLHWALSTGYHALTGNPAAAAKSAHQLVDSQFFYIGAILGLAGWGLVVLYIRAAQSICARIFRHGIGIQRPPARFCQEYVLLAVIGIYSLVWCLALFGPGATAAHQGTYFTEPVLIALGILGFWSVSRRLAVSVAAVSAAFTLWVYIAFTPVKAIAANASSAHNTAQATSSASAYLVVGIAACLASLWWLGTDEFDLGDPDVAGATSESHRSCQRDGHLLFT